MTVKEPETYNDTKKNSLSFRSVRGIQNLEIYRNKQADRCYLQELLLKIAKETKNGNKS